MLIVHRIWRVTLRNLKSTFVRPIASASMFPGVDNSKPPLNWKSLAPSPPLSSVTVAAQSKLPRLPVPDLHETLNKLKESLKPLAKSDEELKEAERKINEFSQGLGKVLQERLLQRQNEEEHWLEEWWDSGAYMGYRDSVVVNVSYFYGFDPHPSHYPQTAVSRAAGLTRAALLFRRQYKSGLLPPEKSKEGPICMDTYRWMFDCCRIPGLNGLDWSVSYAKEGDVGDEGHIIVLRHGRFWKVDIATKNTNGTRLLSMGELEMQLKHIYDNTEKDYPGVGVLTSNNRDTWAENYKTLLKSPLNTSILREIHSSAFVLCLDTSLPPHPSPQFSSPDTALSRILWHGNMHGTDLTNRWVDKPVQFIVTDNAEAGIMGEHSVMDGTPIARMCDNILDWLASSTFDAGESESGTQLENPIALDWDISPELSKAIESAKEESRQLCDSQSLQVLNTLGHGKAIAKKYGFSPDSWAQLIIQLAYSRLLKSLGLSRNGGTYEAASTRKFYKGRTETVRIVSDASDAWVSSMDRDGVSVEERIRMFKEAAGVHNRLAREAGNAKGCDRHLFGLKHLLKPDETLPALFDDSLYKRSSYWVLSTSAIFSKHFDAYGWGEVVPDGFGVAYMTGFDDRFMFTITTRTDMPLGKFCGEIQRAADDLLELFKSSEDNNIHGSTEKRVDGQSQSKL